MFNDKEYCIKDDLDKPQHYYELIDNQPGDLVGSFKKKKVGDKERYFIEDKVANETWIYSIDEENVLGKKVAFVYNGKPKTIKKYTK